MDSPFREKHPHDMSIPFIRAYDKAIIKTIFNKIVTNAASFLYKPKIKNKPTTNSSDTSMTAKNGTITSGKI